MPGECEFLLFVLLSIYYLEEKENRFAQLVSVDHVMTSQGFLDISHENKASHCSLCIRIRTAQQELE
jgi:hypothetical protein